MKEQNKPDTIFCTSEEVRNIRLSICDQCEYKQTITHIDLCTKCACVIPWKTWLKIAECPIKKWDKEL